MSIVQGVPPLGGVLVETLNPAQSINQSARRRQTMVGWGKQAILQLNASISRKR